MKARVDLTARSKAAEAHAASLEEDLRLSRAKVLALAEALEQQQAHTERLRKALEGLLTAIPEETECEQCGEMTAVCAKDHIWADCRAALAETPAQSLAQVQAEALREAANLIRQTTPDARSNSNVERGKFEGRMYAIEQLESEAERLEKEAANEHDNK